MQLFSVDCYLDKKNFVQHSLISDSVLRLVSTQCLIKNTLVRPRDVRIRQGDIRDPERAIM